MLTSLRPVGITSVSSHHLHLQFLRSSWLVDFGQRINLEWITHNNLGGPNDLSSCTFEVYSFRVYHLYTASFQNPCNNLS